MNPFPNQIRCFLVEATGQTREVEYDCGVAGCSVAHSKTETEWIRRDTGHRWWGYPDDAGPGAMWLAEVWMKEDGKSREWDNDSGKHLYVITPSGRPWDIDSRCANCKSPNDRLHRCWIRRGDPPLVTVDKGGLTCAAGAGSIVSGPYHGFLRGGVFTASC